MLTKLESFLDGKRGVVQILSCQESGMATLLHDLPDFLILKIFSFLRIRQRLYLRRVSKTWFQLLYDFSIWKNINMNEEFCLSSYANKEILKQWILDFGRTLQSLDLNSTDWITDNEVRQVARACFNLRKFGVRACSKVTDAGILEIAHNCPRLEHIDVFLTRVSSEGFEEIVRNCPRIKSAKLGSHGNTHRMLASVCEYSSGITQLSIHDVVPYSATEPTVDDPVVSRMVLKFPGIERLSFIWCCFITDVSLVTLANGCPALRGLKLRECQQISDQGLKEILEKCAQLEYLGLERLYKVTDMLVQSHLGEGITFSNIRKLQIFDTKLTDVGVEKLVERCPQLRDLAFGEYSFHPKYIKGICIANVARTCEKLKSLHVFCEEVNDESLFAISECLTDINDLSLGDCRRCTAAGVLKIAARCRSLLRLSIKNCNSFGGKELCEIRNRLPYLKTLELPGNTRISPLFGSWCYMTKTQNHLRSP